MLNTELIHPEILSILGGAGHGSKILIADGNYPFSTKLGINAQQVNLNLSPGLINCEQAASAIFSAVPIEEAIVMQHETEGPYALDAEPPVWQTYEKLLQQYAPSVSLQALAKPLFNELVNTPDVALVIATGDLSRFANLLLTIGVRMEH